MSSHFKKYIHVTIYDGSNIIQLQQYSTSCLICSEVGATKTICCEGKSGLCILRVPWIHSSIASKKLLPGLTKKWIFCLGARNSQIDCRAACALEKHLLSNHNQRGNL